MIPATGTGHCPPVTRRNPEQNTEKGSAPPCVDITKSALPKPMNTGSILQRIIDTIPVEERGNWSTALTNVLPILMELGLTSDLLCAFSNCPPSKEDFLLVFQILEAVKRAYGIEKRDQRTLFVSLFNVLDRPDPRSFEHPKLKEVSKAKATFAILLAKVKVEDLDEETIDNIKKSALGPQADSLVQCKEPRETMAKVIAHVSSTMDLIVEATKKQEVLKIIFGDHSDQMEETEGFPQGEVSQLTSEALTASRGAEGLLDILKEVGERAKSRTAYRRVLQESDKTHSGNLKLLGRCQPNNRYTAIEKVVTSFPVEMVTTELVTKAAELFSIDLNYGSTLQIKDMTCIYLSLFSELPTLEMSQKALTAGDATLLLGQLSQLNCFNPQQKRLLFTSWLNDEEGEGPFAPLKNRKSIANFVASLTKLDATEKTASQVLALTEKSPKVAEGILQSRKEPAHITAHIERLSHFKNCKDDLFRAIKYCTLASTYKKRRREGLPPPPPPKRPKLEKLEHALTLT